MSSFLKKSRARDTTINTISEAVIQARFRNNIFELAINNRKEDSIWTI